MTIIELFPDLHLSHAGNIISYTAELLFAVLVEKLFHLFQGTSKSFIRIYLVYSSLVSALFYQLFFNILSDSFLKSNHRNLNADLDRCHHMVLNWFKIPGDFQVDCGYYE